MPSRDGIEATRNDFRAAISAGGLSSKRLTLPCGPPVLKRSCRLAGVGYAIKGTIGPLSPPRARIGSTRSISALSMPIS